jgi:hypothetical protein
MQLTAKIANALLIIQRRLQKIQNADEIAGILNLRYPVLIRLFANVNNFNGGLKPKV